MLQARRPEVWATELAEALSGLDPSALKAVMIEVLQASAPLPFVEISGRYDGNLVLTPADQDLKPKELALDQYVGKMVAIRTAISASRWTFESSPSSWTSSSELTTRRSSRKSSVSGDVAKW